LTFEHETIETLRRKAKEEGFNRPSVLARYLLLRGLREDMKAEIDENQRVLRVPVNNYREIKAYVEGKRRGRISDFVTALIEREMSSHPLTAAQKARVEEDN
jgi:c-di-AMP phosphodiesterase-like protein